MANSTGDQGQKRVQVIERTVDVLKALSFHSNGLTLTALSEEVNLHKATVSRFLGALEKTGMAERSEATKVWTLGPAMFEMTARAARRKDLRDVARPIMEQLSKDVEQTVQLGILVDNHIFYVEKIEPADLALKLNTTIGSTRPIHCTALGKVLAADLAKEDVLRILKEEGQVVKTDKTIGRHRLISMSWRECARMATQSMMANITAWWFVLPLRCVMSRGRWWQA